MSRKGLLGESYNLEAIVVRWRQAMNSYNRDIYSRTFARLLNKAMKRGEGDPREALNWLDKRYKAILGFLFTRHRLESVDAYLDVREHILKRIEGLETGDQRERFETRD